MSNYPDDFPHHLLDDEDGNKLSCGCYEEDCECPCEHEDIDLVEEVHELDDVVYLWYHCNDCDINGVAKQTCSAIIWGEEE